MTSSAACFLSLAWERTVEVLRGAQTEILIFLIAFVMHAILFHNPRARAQKTAKVAKTVDPDSCHRDASEKNDAVAHNPVIKALHQGNIQKAREALRKLCQSGVQPNHATFNELLDATIKTSMQSAWTLIEEMQACGVKPDHITCSILLKPLSHERHPHADSVARICELMEQMDDDIDEALLNYLVEVCMHVGRGDLLAPHFKVSPLKKIHTTKTRTYSSVIRAYGLIGDLDGVWDTWREMRKCHVMPSSISLGCMVEALTSNGSVEASYELILEMLADEQCKPLVNAVVYGSVLKGFSHQKRFDRVLSMYQEMLEHKLQFSLVTFNTLVDACARSNEMARIPDLLRSMTEQGIPPNIITYSIIVKGYCQENRLDEALEVWRSMVQTTNLQPDEVMYNTILAGCARQGKYERSMHLFGEMEAAGIRPSNFTLSVLVKLAKNGRHVDWAFQLCDDVSQRHKFRLNVHVYNNLVLACIGNNDIPRAFTVLETMVRDRVRPDARTYTLLLPAVVASGKAADVAGLIKAAFGLKDAQPRLMKLQGGLPHNLLAESLEGIARECGDDHLALALMKDLQGVPGATLPPQLKMRIANRAIRK